MFCLPVPTLIYLWEIIYFQDRSAYSAAGKYVDWSWEYTHRSQTNEWGNWDWGRGIPRKGIHKWDFPCSVPWLSWFRFFSQKFVNEGEDAGGEVGEFRNSQQFFCLCCTHHGIFKYWVSYSTLLTNVTILSICFFNCSAKPRDTNPPATVFCNTSLFMNRRQWKKSRKNHGKVNYAWIFEKYELRDHNMLWGSWLSV